MKTIPPTTAQTLRQTKAHTLRLTTAQALVRYLLAREVSPGVPYIAGMWAIFGHGNVAALGDALHEAREHLPTWRGHNEQGMAHAAIAYAKSHNRRRAMAVTSSIGPGATNMVTAAAVAHVNRLPILFLPGDVFANRLPDPVLQQLEDFQNGTVSANDCFRPVSRYFDRITRPEQLLTALPRALAVMSDPAECGPVTLCLHQDVQAEAWDWPPEFFETRAVRFRRPAPDEDQLADAADAIRAAKNPLIISGGGIHYSLAVETLKRFTECHNVPVAETQAGKSALPWDHPLNLGSIGVTGSSTANTVAEKADLVLAVGTRLQDFTTGSRALFKNPLMRLIQLNVTTFDTGKHNALPLICDAKIGLDALSIKLADWQSEGIDDAQHQHWLAAVDAATGDNPSQNRPSDAQVIGAVQRGTDENTIVVCAAGGLPGELHKLWKSRSTRDYHLEYGYSCMGYEIAGGMGVKMAQPDKDVIVMVGDGSYLMMNSELATAQMLGHYIIVVLLDNRGFGCINRLQQGTGGANFNNLLDQARHLHLADIDFVAHARSLGAHAEKADTLEGLTTAIEKARLRQQCSCIVIDTDPAVSTQAGGAWWDVAVPEISARESVRKSRAAYEKHVQRRNTRKWRS